MKYIFVGKQVLQLFIDYNYKYINKKTNYLYVYIRARGNF